VPGSGETGHVGADLGQDDMSAGQADAGDLVEAGHQVCEGGSLGGDPGGPGGDIGADRIHPAQHCGEQERVVFGEAAGERLLQHGDLLAHAAPGQLRQHLGVTLPSGQGGEHVAAGDAEDVSDDRAQLDLRVLEQLFHPLLFRGPGGDQVRAITGQVPQLADRRWRHEAGVQDLPLGDLAEPDRIQHVGLGPAGQVLDVFGVDQPGLEPGRFQQVEHRLPVIGRGLLHPGHPQASRSAMPSSERVSVEQATTSCSRLPGWSSSGTRTQHTSSALPISHAATRSMISSSSCVLDSFWPPDLDRRPLPAGARGTAGEI
jgi:hypothetical protein